MSKPKQNDDYVKLCETIKNRDEVKARNLILNNVNVNSDKLQCNTPLHWAIIKFENLDIITMLLDKGANILATNHRRSKPLKVAIQYNKIQAALLLIERGALVGEDFNSLLLIAIEQQNSAIVKILIDNGMQYKPSMDLKIPLYVAILRGQPKIIQQIIPNCRFLKPSDKYIPRDVVMKSDPQYKECLELLLEWNFTVNPDSKNDGHFVYAAVKKGYLSIVMQLLKFGIDVNMVNPTTGLNLLKVACLHKHHEIVGNLLKHNACINVKTPTNTKILKNLSHYNYNHPLLLIHDTNDLCDITCLHIAVLNSDPKITKLLLRYGAKIIDDPKFFNLTCIAVRSNCEEIVRMFLDRGVNVANVDSEGKSLLHSCVLATYDGQDSRYNIAKLLLEQGANIHIRTPGNSLLFETIKNRYRKTAQLFLDYNADIQYISRDGDTLLHKAIENDFDVKFIKTLLKRKSPVNVVNNDILTPLHVASRIKSVNQVKIIQALLDYNANVNCAVYGANIIANLGDFGFLLNKINIYNIDDAGQTPLHFICKYKTDMTESIIQLLLQHNVNIEAVDAKGWTPLFEACYSSNNLAVKCLLDNHANANRTDFKKLTPLYIAAKNCENNSEIIKILLEHKVNVHCMDKWGNSIIHVVVNQSNAELIKYLAHTQINFNSVNRDGNTPLHIAVHRQSVDTVKNLIKYGANVNILNKKNQTPLIVATKNTLYFQFEIEKNKKIMKIFKIQIVKLKAAGLKMSNWNLKIIYNPNSYVISDNEFSDEYDFNHKDAEINILQLELICEQEIEKMRTESIGVKNITFYDFLTRNIHFLCRFVKNKNIRQTLDLEVYDAKFPLYIDIVRNRFRDAKFRYRIMNSAKQYFFSNITQRLSDNCIDTIFSYLNIQALKLFIRAMKPLNV